MKPMNPSGISNFTQVLNSFFKVFTGNIGFGSPSSYDANGNGTTFNTDNMAGQIVRVGSVSNPFSLANFWSGSNVATVITHNLNRRPVGFYVMQKSKSADIYNGSPFVATATTITLYCTDDTVDATVFVF